jgi:type IV pilus assembly protein PilQ
MIKIIFQIILFITIFFNFNIFAGKYHGEKVNLVFKDADIKNVLMLFAEYEDKNFIIDEKIKGKITIRLRNVPWDQALNLILDMKNLHKIVDGNIIRIVPLSYVKAKELEKIRQKERNKKLAPIKTKVFYVNFAKAEDISKKVKKLLSKRGSIITDKRTNSIIVSDIPDNILKIKNILDVLDKPTPQVIIEAKIVVVKNTVSDELGIQWGGSFIQRMKSNDFFYGINGYSSISSSTGVPNITTAIPPKNEPSRENLLSVPVPSNYIVNAPTVHTPVGGLGLIFGKWGYYNLSIKLSALKTKDLAKEISAPKVIALDNEKAIIGQGQEIPYKTVSDKGTKTEFKDAKLKLEVTPHITSNNMVMLDIKLSKDSIGQQTTDGPAINTQQIETKLLLGNGEAAVIGGIISNSETNGESAVPFFSDIPIFGNLFKNSIKEKIKGELLIIITPRIVDRSSLNRGIKVGDDHEVIKSLDKYINIDYNTNKKKIEKDVEPKNIIKNSQKNIKKQKKVNIRPKQKDNAYKKKKICNVNAKINTKQNYSAMPQGVVVRLIPLLKQPSVKSEILLSLRKGDIVTLLDTSKAPWYYVSFKSKKGWVFKFINIEK